MWSITVHGPLVTTYHLQMLSGYNAILMVLKGIVACDFVIMVITLRIIYTFLSLRGFAMKCFVNTQHE